MKKKNIEKRTKAEKKAIHDENVQHFVYGTFINKIFNAKNATRQTTATELNNCSSSIKNGCIASDQRSLAIAHTNRYLLHSISTWTATWMFDQELKNSVVFPRADFAFFFSSIQMKTKKLPITSEMHWKHVKMEIQEKNVEKL